MLYFCINFFFFRTKKRRNEKSNVIAIDDIDEGDADGEGGIIVNYPGRIRQFLNCKKRSF
jgi:hypothetical protein